MKPLAFSLIAIALLPWGASAADWTNWRGPNHDGVSAEGNLPAKWSPEGENLIWKAPFGCRSTPLIMKGRVFLLNYDEKIVNGAALPDSIQERIMALDEKTGKVIWEMKFNVYHTDIVTVRLGWTNMTADPETGYLYAHTTAGYLFCIDAMGNEPKIVWQRQLTEEFGRVSGYGGRLTSPALFEDMIIVGMVNSSWGNHAKGGNRLVALNKSTGAVVWWADPTSLPKDTYYSSPVVGRIGGQDLVITGSCDGYVHAIKARTGEVLWSHKFGQGSVNSTAIVHGDRIYIGHGEENPESGNNHQGRVLCIDGSGGKPKVVWQEDDVKARYTTPILHEGKLYITDDIAKLFCFDADKGKLLWTYTYGRNARGSPTLADGKIYVGEVNSKFHILDIKTAAKKKRLHEQFFPALHSVSDVECNGTPAVANGRVFLSTSEETYCIGLKDPGIAPSSKQASPSPKPGAPATLSIYPAEITIHPGETFEFKLRTHDAQGFPAGEVDASKVEWKMGTPPLPPGAKVAPPPLEGTIKAGTLTVDSKKPTQHGYVEATFGKLVGKARVRVAPKLPYSQDFSKVPDGAAPMGWVNTTGKFYVATDKNGEKVLKKVNDKASPLVAKGNAYIGLPGLKDYTIECDVLGTKVGADMPDVGVVNNRYTLMLAGNIQRLRIVSWDALPRVDATVTFPWKDGVWYRLKLTTEVKGDKIVVKGKAWDRTQAEPAAWTAEVTDSYPNLEGAPALYGYVTGIPQGGNGTDVLYDNVTIKPNGK